MPTIHEVALGATLIALATVSAAEEVPAAVACPCADIYLAARAEYEKHPGPTFCQSARILPPDTWSEVSLNATKKRLTGSKWHRVHLDIAVFERCLLNIRCAKCSAHVHAEKRFSLFVHELYGKTQSDLSDAELAACKALIRTLEECGRPYMRSQPPE